MKKAFLLLLLITLLLSACAPGAGSTITQPAIDLTAFATELAATVIAQIQQTDVAIPSTTPLPSETPLPPTETPLPTNTPVPTPVADFANLRITSIESPAGAGYVVINLPGINMSLSMSLQGFDFDCKFDPTVADRLFCTGLRVPSFTNPSDIEFADPISGQVVYVGTTQLTVSMFPTPTPASSNWCPDRGKNLDAEWECRVDHDGNPCVVATVRDACGYYYSVHTCPEQSDWKICSPAQFEAMRSLYGFP